MADIRTAEGPAVSAWNPVTTASGVYIASLTSSQNGFNLLFSDMGAMWACESGEADILSLSQSLNPNIDAPLKTILQHIETAFSEPGKIAASFDVDKEEFCELKMSSQLAGFPFRWNFFLEEVQSERLMKHLTLPLMMMVAELSREKNEMAKIIRKKDSEIENYRMQGIKVTRKNLETEKFDADKFAEETVASEGFDKELERLGLGALSRTNQQIYTAILKKKNCLETEWGELKLSDAWCTDPVKKSPVKSPVKEQAAVAAEQQERKTQIDTERDRKRALQEKLVKEGQKMEESKRKKKKLKL